MTARGLVGGAERAWLALVVAAACVPACAAAAAPRGRTTNVVIVVIDGVRHSETFGDAERANVPNLAKGLAPRGVVFTNFRNEGSTSTNPGHVALVTGRYEAVSNDGRQLPSAPVMTQLFLERSRLPASSAAVVVSKDKLHVLANSAAPEWKDRYVATTSAGKKGFGTGYREDRDTFKELVKILKRDHPRLVVVNFKGPDATGHAKRWDAYLGAIRECDRYAGELWQTLQSDRFYANKTALFVTHDHGRHLDEKGGFQNHGCPCEGCRRLMLVAVGPDFRKGVVVDEPREQIDLAPTVGAILGFDVPDSKGRVLGELHGAPEPAAKPAR